MLLWTEGFVHKAESAMDGRTSSTIEQLKMAAIQIPPVTPLWEHPSTKIRGILMWKQQLEVMHDLTHAQCAVHKKLKDAEKFLIMYAHLGTEAI
uniref:Uncharacterized protein n=1 Tax=Romanomermis culicivorax TaxID=13658 RepID=A0A915L0E8_ROMCU